MRLACSTAAFPEDRLQIALAKVAWAGFRCAELSVPGETLPPAAETRAFLLANELDLAALHAGALPGEPGEGGMNALARICRAVALARTLDAPLVVVQAPGAGTPGGLAEALRLLDRALGETAVDLCVVNRGDTCLAAPAELAALWREGLPGRVGLALDPGQAELSGWDPSALDALPQLPRHVYFNDAGGGRIVPPGEGRLDLRALAEALKVRGYSGAVTVLLESADPWAVEPLAREARAAGETWFG